MNAEIQHKLMRFQPRPYQGRIVDALENKKYKRILAIWPRRAGKDIVAFNLMVRAALRKTAVYYYIFPTYAQAKKVLYDGITNTGERIINYYLPEELIESNNSQEMKIRLKNGSLIQFCGSDNYDSLMGTNPQGIVFSEYALQNPIAYLYLNPILMGNDGWAIFLSTPRGKNHLYTLYERTKDNKDWYVSKLTINDTNHISLFEIEKENISKDMIQQEYFTDFSLGIVGSYFSRYVNDMRLDGRIGDHQWNPNLPVSCAWDLGFSDATSIIFFQLPRNSNSIFIIDYYENSKMGLEHYVKIIQSKPYNYYKHVLPHDARHHEQISAMSRVSKLNQLGLRTIIADNLTIPDGIEAVRTVLPRVFIDQRNCERLIQCLENYRSQYDETKRIYNLRPVHDEFSHGCDAMRYLSITVNKLSQGLTPEQLDKNYIEACYGEQSNYPKFFQDNYETPSVFREDLPNY